MDKLVSIIVPAFNEVQSLRELFYRVKKVMDSEGIPFELIFIDDGSNDGTFDLLSEITRENDNVVGIRHAKRHGKSMALMQGFHYAKGDIAVTMDADLQDQPEAIPILLKKLNEGHDLVNGWRKYRKDKRKKIFISKIYNYLIKLFFSYDIKDINSGFKAMRREVYKILRLKGDLHRLIPLITYLHGFKCCEVPVPHAGRKYGTSKYNLLRHRGILDIVVLLASNTTKIRPFHVFSEIAFFIFLLGLFLITGNILLSDGIFSKLLFFTGIWAIFLGTILPFFGFILEFLSSEFQTKDWQTSLVRNVIDTREMNVEQVLGSENISQPR